MGCAMDADVSEIETERTSDGIKVDGITVDAITVGGITADEDAVGRASAEPRWFGPVSPCGLVNVGSLSGLSSRKCTRAVVPASPGGSSKNSALEITSRGICSLRN